MKKFLFLFCLLAGIGWVACSPEAPKKAFIDKLQPAPVNGGFAIDSMWIWGSSVIKGEDGKYHIFSDMWAKDLGFGAWVTSTEIAHGVSDTPEGPYVYSDMALTRRDPKYFDGCSVMNPRVIRYGDWYYMYYVGTTYDFPVPEAGVKWEDDWFERAWMNKRIGVAKSKSLYGPWERMDHPVLEPRPGKWDATITSNPSPVVNSETGKILLIYKSSSKNSQPPLLLGAAEADSPQGEYHRLSDEPIFRFDTEANLANDVEDPFVWWADGHYELIMKDRFGHICGEDGGGIHATSPDGVHWTLSNPVKAYSRTIKWSDGTETHQANFERPFILIEDGKPAYLFAATGTGPAPWNFERTWTMVIPLSK